MVLAFPTAEGYGANSVGGRQGRVIFVTNLNNSGAGSFRDACSQSGPRNVIFKVSGTIALTSQINITNPYITIAGQTSPGGIQLKGGTTQTIDMLQVRASHVIIRHLRSRPGYQGAPVGESGASLRVYSPTGSPIITDVIIDHCSCEWASDDTLSTYQNIDRVTFQWNLVGRTTTAGVSVGSEGKGMTWGGYQGLNPAATLSWHHNLIAHSAGRNPRSGWCGTMDFVNNLIYNWGSAAPPSFNGAHAFEMDDARGTNQPTLRLNFVKNHYIPGPNSQWTGNSPYLLLGAQAAGSRLFLSGNFTPDFPSGTADDWSNPWRNGDTSALALVGIGGGGYKSGSRFTAPALTETATASLKALLTGASGVGARKPSRDSLDAAILAEVNAGTGNITSNGAGGPWPTLTGGAYPTDSDNDGIPDAWEIANGLDPNNPVDANNLTPSGYTNLENYLNELAGDTVSSGTPDTTPPVISITSPSNGATVSGTVILTANATDNVGVANVQFYLDGTVLGGPLT